MIPWLDDSSLFPPLESALGDPNGLLAAGGDLSVARLLDAYRRGIFPWYSGEQPVLWWSPDPRSVLFVEEMRISRSLRKAVLSGRFDVRIDSAFREVLQCCATIGRPGQAGTWITPAVVKAYCALFARGHAHSVEAWSGDELVGGLYGVSIGRMFFGESMFAHATDASKVALAHLAAMLHRAGFPLIDCQQQTPHLGSLGARSIARAEFAKHLATLVNCSEPDQAWRPLAPTEVLEWRS